MRQIVLLRGINLGSHNRIAMPALRELLAGAGLDEVRTYLGSGNVVLASKLPPDKVASKIARQIADEFGFDIEVVVRTRAELAAVVKRNPLARVATDPKLYQVSFYAAKPDAALMEKLSALAAGDEQLKAVGREVYTWHPDGIARSKLASGLAARRRGVTVTARNWKTVESLLAMADES